MYAIRFTFEVFALTWAIPKLRAIAKSSPTGIRVACFPLMRKILSRPISILCFGAELFAVLTFAPIPNRARTACGMFRFAAA